MGCLDIMQNLAKKVREKFLCAAAKDIPGSPDYLCFIERMMGQCELDNPDAWLGYALAMAECLGVIDHGEVLDILNNKPRELQSEIACELMRLGVGGKVNSIKFSLTRGLEIAVKGRTKSPIRVEGHQEIVECLSVLQYLQCAHGQNRPRSSIGGTSN